MNDYLETILKKYREKEGNIIFLLQETEEEFGYIPREAVDYYAEELNIAPSRFYGVATFYSQFHLNPRGKNIITACCGTACHVKGSLAQLDHVGGMRPAVDAGEASQAHCRHGVIQTLQQFIG